MSKLSASDRKSLPTQDFAVKSKAGTPQGKAKGGSFPIPDKAHAQNALARSSGKPVAAQVKAAVAKKFPGMVKGSKNSSSVKKNISNIKSNLANRSKNKTSVGF